MGAKGDSETYFSACTACSRSRAQGAFQNSWIITDPSANCLYKHGTELSSLADNDQSLFFHNIVHVMLAAILADVHQKGPAAALILSK